MKEDLYTLRWLVTNFWGKDEGKDSSLKILNKLLEAPFSLEEAPALLGKRVAIVVGHSTKDKGAVAVDGTQEWNWNKQNAELIKKELSFLGIESKIFFRNPNSGYSSSMNQLAREIKSYRADASIELHFNSFSEDSNGTEAVVSGSTESVSLAKEILAEWSLTFPDLNLRRDNGVYVNPNGRGSGFNNRVHCPSVVWEPIFGSNPSEWNRYKLKQVEMSKSLAKGLHNYLS